MSQRYRILPAVCFVATAFSGTVSAGENSFDEPAPPTRDATGNPVIESLTFSAPHEVKQIRATTDGNWLQVGVEDCCIVGDRFTQRTYCLQNGNVWDVRGKGAGNTTFFTGKTLVFKQGVQPIDCITEIRYGEGVATFPAGMSVSFEVPAGSTVTTTIETTLNPLPSQ